MKKRLISLLLVIVMVLGADPGDGTGGECGEQHGGKGGGNWHRLCL